MTVMIGVNDTMPETVTLDNAQTLYGMASSDGVGLLSMWSISRDHACPGNGHYVDAQWSGIVQSPLAFSTLLKDLLSTGVAA